MGSHRPGMRGRLMQPENGRRVLGTGICKFLRYLKQEKTEVADNGDGSYTLTVKGDYRSNAQSDSCPNGFNQEETIRKIFLGR